MLKKLQLKSWFLLLAVLLGGGSAWAEEVTIASFSNSVNEGWTINGTPSYSNSGGYQLVASTMSIVSPSIAWSNYSDIKITIKARKYGGPNATQGKISVSQGETELLSVSPSSTSLTNYGPSEISPVDGAITISCPGASSNKGCGISEITITGTYQAGSTYSVTYNANGATSGTVPTDATEYDADNNTVTVLGNTGNLAKEHYTFNGWNTKADGTGTDYDADDTFEISANTTLYAQWVANTNIVTLPETDQYGTYTMSATNPVAYGTEVILTYTPAVGYEKYQATWSVNGEEILGSQFTMPDEVVTVTVSVMEVTTSDMVVDFEDNTSTYTDWTFTNINGKATDSGVNPHGGSYFGVTAGTQTASIVTKEKVNPVSLTCYVSKKSTNTSSSTWYVQVSEDGNTWTEVGSCNGASMSKGEWKELTAALKNYSDVYVRVYYSGSTAVRCIDDLTLTVNGGSVKPSISASDVNIDYDTTSGSIAYSINNPIDGGVLTATTENDWLTIGTVGTTEVPFTCSANEDAAERTATVTLTYSYGDNEPVTKVVTVTQAAAPVIYSTIPALFAAATSTETEVSVTFDNWVVSGVSTNGKNIFVTDNEGNGFVIYYNSDMSETYSAGKILSGTAVTCTLKKYNGFAELVNVDATALTISDGGTVTEATVAMADLSGVNTGALVSYENLTCSVENSKYYLSDGTTTLQVYNALYAFDALEEGKTYNIKGIYQQYNNTKEILPRSADDVVEVVSTVSSITVNPSTVDVNAGEHDGTLAITYANLTITYMSDFGVQYYNAEGEELSDEDAPDWIEVTVATQDPQVGEGYVVSYYMIDNDGESRSAYFKVYAMDDETNLVYSNLITVNQAAYVPTTNYTLATTLVPGKHYVIASGTNGEVYAMGKMKTTNREAVKVTAEEGVIALTGEEGAYEFLIQGPDKNDNYTIYDESNESTGYLYAAGGTNNNHLKVQATKNSNAEWSISIDGEGVATIKAKMNDDSDNDHNWMRFNNGSSKLFSCYNSSSNQGDIYLFEKVGEAAPTEETITISDVKYATYCTKNALDFTGTGVTAYIAKMEGNIVKFTPVTKVPAYEGVLLKADAAGDFTVGTSTSVDTENWNNAFIGVTEATKVTETGIFVLMNGDEGVGFYKTTQAFTVGAHTAYLPALAGGSDGARSFIGFDFDNTTTGVNGIAAETMANGAVYNLQGQRISESVIRNSELKSGLYIVNGKKVLVK